MIFNYYKFVFETSSFSQIHNEKLPNQILRKLLNLEYGIVEEFLKKQENSPGIKKLGNEIKRNETINKVFSNKGAENYCLVKLTAHYQSYLNTIVGSLRENFDKDIFLFVLEDEFRRNSKLVDSSSKGANFVREILLKISSTFKPIKKNLSLNIIEMKGFSNYFTVENYGYSKLIKHKKDV